MKRLIVALLVGGAVFGTVFAVAASLIVTGGTLQMSSGVDAVCDSDGVTLGYLFSDPNPGNSNLDEDVVTEAQVGDIDDACIGDQLTVELFVGSAKCDEGEATIVNNGSDSDDNTLLIPLNSTCDVLDVTVSYVNIAGQAVWP